VKSIILLDGLLGIPWERKTVEGIFLSLDTSNFAVPAETSSLLFTALPFRSFSPATDRTATQNKTASATRLTIFSGVSRGFCKIPIFKFCQSENSFGKKICNQFRHWQNSVNDGIIS
jgi:hypothetical protein